MSMKSIARMGSTGNTDLLKSYGGSEVREKYATGGKVTGVPSTASCTSKGSFASGGSVDGSGARPRLDRPGRKMKAKDKKGGTNVNVIVMPKGGDAGPPAMPAGGPPVMAGPPPGMPPMDAGPMPVPMHKSGGKVRAFKKGGVVKKADGGGVTGYLRGKATNSTMGALAHGAIAGGLAPIAIIDPEPASKLIAGGLGLANAAYAKSNYDDAKRYSGAAKKFENTGLPNGPSKDDQDGKKSGGPVKMNAGSGGGKGRLEKMKAYAK